MFKEGHYTLVVKEGRKEGKLPQGSTMLELVSSCGDAVDLALKGVC